MADFGGKPGAQQDFRLTVYTAAGADGQERQVCRGLCRDGDPDDLFQLDHLQSR